MYLSEPRFQGQLKLAIEEVTHVDGAVGNMILYVIQVMNETPAVGFGNSGMPALVPNLDYILENTIAFSAKLENEFESLIDCVEYPLGVPASRSAIRSQKQFINPPESLKERQVLSTNLRDGLKDFEIVAIEFGRFKVGIQEMHEFVVVTLEFGCQPKPFPVGLGPDGRISEILPRGRMW